jgi:hypothetical protein
MNIKKLVLCAALLCTMAALAAAQSNAARGKAEVTIKGKQISIDYGRHWEAIVYPKSLSGASGG